MPKGYIRREKQQTPFETHERTPYQKLLIVAPRWDMDNVNIVKAHWHEDNTRMKGVA